LPLTYYLLLHVQSLWQLRSSLHGSRGRCMPAAATTQAAADPKRHRSSLIEWLWTCENFWDSGKRQSRQWATRTYASSSCLRNKPARWQLLYAAMEARSPSAAHQRSGPQCLCAQAPVWPPLGLAQASGPRPPWSGLWLDLGLGPADEHVRARAQPVQLCLNLCILCLAGRAPPSRASAAPAGPDSVPQYTAGRV
jgi:hypothetical protein